MPEVGLEPTQISPRDFESRASTDFATPAGGGKTKKIPNLGCMATAFHTFGDFCFVCRAQVYFAFYRQGE